MTDFNTTTETQPEAKPAKAAKPAKEITTAKHARHLAGAARKRAEKFRTQAAEADEQAAKYDELAATLPESNPAASARKARPVVEVGTAVTFRFGRATSTRPSRVLNGVVTARKYGEDGKPKAYKIAVGEGFDEELFTVQPGSILLVDPDVPQRDVEAERTLWMTGSESEAAEYPQVAEHEFGDL